MSPLTETAARAIAAYGGVERWRNARTIEAEVSARGLAFTLKRRPAFDRAVLHMDVGKPLSRITPIGRDKNISGVLDGGHVRLENDRGETVAERTNARAFFPYGRRLFFWDDLDMAYFANYASWNYFTLPRLLMNDTISWTEAAPGRLTAVFPPSIPTHSARQEFVFDMETGRLLQHNYSADIISPLATAAHVVVEHSETDGLPHPSVRRVTPRTRTGNAMGGPVLIDLRVHRIQLR